MKTSFRLVLAQLDFTVGALDANAARMREVMAEARQRLGAQLVLFPELALCGYSPEDLLLRPGFLAACRTTLDELAHASAGLTGLVGYPLPMAASEGMVTGAEPCLANAVAILRDGALTGHYAKQALPDYGVFDERRYFRPGADSCVVAVRGLRVGVLVCEDIWSDGPIDDACAEGAELIVVLNASPYAQGKQARRRAVLTRQARRHGVGIAYLNLVGGQDELLFDGASLLVDADGTIAAEAPAFVDALLAADYDPATRRFHAIDWPAPVTDDLAGLYAGLARGLRDYVDKNGFPGVLLGLSGGIDSALTLALAVDALGPERVTAVMLPSRYTSELSLQGARAQAERLGVAYQVLSIEPGREALLTTLAPAFAGKAADLAEENVQARLRGVLLMALSNKHGQLLLTTGNKSEVAVGYATLYGDMCGGYAPLKDVYKTLVYRLARWRNGTAAEAVIPWEVIERPPSAELREDQTDQDSLPPYDVLDAILERFIEGDRSQSEIVLEGFDAGLVQRIVRLVYLNEFKRRQAAPGPKVTARAFGRERRYPITSKWR
ncbi:MAG TPA: NAD+ synthase [Rhodanobacteraceae bacterium]|nr:NAD+ synthase [Rhodanobacteraceae bacterium]